VTNFLIGVYFGIGLFWALSVVALMRTEHLPQNDNAEFTFFVQQQRMRFELLSDEERVLLILRIVTLWPFLRFLEQQR
jgi:hypothetical protein